VRAAGPSSSASRASAGRDPPRVAGSPLTRTAQAICPGSPGLRVRCPRGGCWYPGETGPHRCARGCRGGTLDP
jgi:hypothetical protein